MCFWRVRLKASKVHALGEFTHKYTECENERERKKERDRGKASNFKLLISFLKQIS